MKPTSSDINMLLAATGYLMTHYSLCSNEKTAHGVVHHLEMILAHPRILDSPRTHKVYQGLLGQWHEIVTRHQCIDKPGKLWQGKRLN